MMWTNLNFKNGVFLILHAIGLTDFEIEAMNIESVARMYKIYSDREKEPKSHPPKNDAISRMSI